MSIEVACSCGNKILVKEGLMGRRVKCPACGAGMLVGSESQPDEMLEDAETLRSPTEQVQPESRPLSGIPTSGSSKLIAGFRAKSTLWAVIVAGVLVVAAVVAYFVFFPPDGANKSSGGPDLAKPSARAHGVLNRTDSAQLTGWAWDPDQPNATVKVDIFAGERLLATIPADILRGEFKKKKMGTGQHAFVFVLPPFLRDGKEHVIHAKISGTDKDLEGSPQTVTLQKPKAKDAARPAAKDGEKPVAKDEEKGEKKTVSRMEIIGKPDFLAERDPQRPACKHKEESETCFFSRIDVPESAVVHCIAPCKGSRYRALSRLEELDEIAGSVLRRC